MATRKKPVDAVIIGYGWTGAIMAKTLTDAGLSVVALERGPARDTAPDFEYPRIIDELKYGVRGDLWQPLAKESENVAVQRDRGSEVATQRIAHPDGELRQEAAVEPVMRPERRDVRLACARRDHHRDGIAGHDSQKKEHDDRDPCERSDRHQKTPEGRKRYHRFVTTSPRRGSGRPGRADRCLAAQVAGETSVGCKAPDLFGMTLRSDL